MTGVCRAVALLISVLAFTSLPAGGAALEEEFDEAAALAHSQAVLGAPITNAQFVTTAGEAIDLERFEGKPLVLSLIYTSCHHFCPLITESLHRAVSGARDVFGDDAFSIVTVGFDTKYDTPNRMASYASTRGVELPNWHFLSGTDVEIARIAEATGFLFYEAPWGYEHLAQVSVIDAQGRVYTQVYGTAFDPPALIEPLKDLIFGRSASTATLEGFIDRIKLFCTVYDPRKDRYHFDYSIIVALVIGTLVLGSVGVVLGRNAWRLWRPGNTG